MYSPYNVFVCLVAPVERPHVPAPHPLRGGGEGDVFEVISVHSPGDVAAAWGNAVREWIATAFCRFMAPQEFGRRRRGKLGDGQAAADQWE